MQNMFFHSFSGAKLQICVTILTQLSYSTKYAFNYESVSPKHDILPPCCQIGPRILWSFDANKMSLR